MKMDATDLALEAAKIALNPSDYLLTQIVKATSKKVSNAEAATDDEISVLRVEAEKQDLQMRIAEAQARVAQEIAIAKRIENAEEVEMEEFYDYSREGHAGVQTDGKSVSIGANGGSRRVSKRIYRFRGDTAAKSVYEPNEKLVNDPAQTNAKRRNR